MKKIAFIGMVFLGLVWTAPMPVLAQEETPSPAASAALSPAGLSLVNLEFKGATLTAEVANEQAAREMGLRFRKSLGKDEGMLFVFAAPQTLNFWMEDAPTPLGIAFLDEKGTILGLDEMDPNTETIHSSKGPAKFALEMNKGWFAAHGAQPGDPVTGVLDAPPDTEASQKAPYNLDAFQLAWGKSQLEQMFKDRPAMLPYVKEGDDLWNWTVRQFAGEYAKGGVQWDPANPGGDFDSTSCRPDPAHGKKAYIQVSRNFAVQNFKGQPQTGPTLWWEAIVEFSNLQNAVLFNAIDQDSFAGKIGRADNAFEYMAVEDIATNNHSHDLFYGLWVPHCKKMGFPFEDKAFARRFNKVIGRGWPRSAFLSQFEEIGKKDDSPNLTDSQRFATKDFAQHFDWYTGLYDKNIPAILKAKGIPPPNPQPQLEVETKFLDEISPPAETPTAPKPEPVGDHLLMDDFENGAGVNQFGAVWHSAMDHHNLGTLLKNYPFEPQEGGAPGSPKYAARIWGHWGKHVAPWPWVTLRGGFNPEETPADLSAFSGVRFFTKGDQKAYRLQLVQPAVKDTAYYQETFKAPSQWVPITLNFASFQQAPWGAKVPLAWDQVQCFQFIPNDQVFNDEDFDLWIDDIELLK